MHADVRSRHDDFVGMHISIIEELHFVVGGEPHLSNYHSDTMMI